MSIWVILDINQGHLTHYGLFLILPLCESYDTSVGQCLRPWQVIENHFCMRRKMLFTTLFSNAGSPFFVLEIFKF